MKCIPNILTVLRLIIAAAFPFLAPSWRLPTVLLAAGSDWADGFIARRYGLTSWIGALLDGIADKAVTLSVLVTFMHEGLLEWWQLVLILTRDVTVGLIAAYTALRRRWPAFKKMVARWPGKLTTFAVFAYMAALLVLPQHSEWLLWPAIGLSVIAAMDYAIVFLKHLPPSEPPRNG